jgi:hypothetical protein
LAITSPVRLAMPVMLPPGRARLSTRPSAIGSSPSLKTIGMVVDAALAANAAEALGMATITATPLRARSAASAGSRSG